MLPVPTKKSSKAMRPLCINPLIVPSTAISQEFAKPPYRSLHGRERGASKLTLVVFLSIAYVAVVLAYQAILFFYSFNDVQNEMQAICRVAGELKREEMVYRLRFKIAENNLPVKIEDLRINFDGRNAEISLEYSEQLVLELFGRRFLIHTFPFLAYASTEAEKRIGRQQ